MLWCKHIKQNTDITNYEKHSIRLDGKYFKMVPSAKRSLKARFEFHKTVLAYTFKQVFGDSVGVLLNAILSFSFSLLLFFCVLFTIFFHKHVVLQDHCVLFRRQCEICFHGRLQLGKPKRKTQLPIVLYISVSRVTQTHSWTFIIIYHYQMCLFS